MLPVSNWGRVRPPIVSRVTVPTSLPLTGERTVPGVTEENYWFRRHEAAYEWVASRFESRIVKGVVVDAGCGEGYGIDLLSRRGAHAAIGCELERASAQHASARYGETTSLIQANLDALPLATASVDLLVSMQVIEHLWNLPAFLTECRRVLTAGGSAVFSTPNRLTFSPGLGRGERPTNPFHVEEFDPKQLVEIIAGNRFPSVECFGVVHGERLTLWEATHGSIVDAQVTAAIAATPWPSALTAAVAEVDVNDFEIRSDRLDASRDIIVVAHTTEAP